KVGGGTTTRRGGLESGAGPMWRAPRPAVVWSIASLLSAGDAKQTFGGDATICARALHLVDAKKHPLARCTGAGPICADFSARERVDDLGTEIPCARSGSRLGSDLSGTSHHRWSGHLVLPW